MHDPFLDVGPPLEVEPSLEAEPPLEVEAGDGLGKEKLGQGEVNMGPGPRLGETGLWMESSWRRYHEDWRCPRAVRGGWKKKRLLWCTAES